MIQSEIIKMGYVIQSFLEKEKLVDAKPKDLMPILVENGFFTNDHREGLPLRDVLRELDSKNELYLLPQVRVERKEKNRIWYFNMVKVLNPNKVINFHNQIKIDSNNRFNSWKHCYLAFGNMKQDDMVLALHLGFYLASWGMYRGSAAIFQKDYTIHIKAVQIIRDYYDLRCDEKFEVDNSNTIRILELTKKLFNHYKSLHYMIKEELVERKPTDTLISKIIIGTLGCSPAFDRYFIQGVKATGNKFYKIKAISYEELFFFIEYHKEELLELQNKLFLIDKVHYPIFKLVDMYFFYEGFNKNQS